MAEYYPLISRAVAGLRAAKPETRQAIYDRARQALIGQLRAMDPPVPEEAITRETAALDDAIARAEAEVAGPTDAPAAAAPNPGTVTNNGPKPSAPTITPSSPQPKSAPEAPSLGGANRDEKPRVKGVQAPRPQVPAPLPRPAPPRSAVRATPDNKPAIPDRAAAEVPAPAMPTAAVLRVESTTPAQVDPDESITESPPVEATGAEAADSEVAAERQKDEGARPAAPRPAAERGPSLRGWIVAVAALAAVAVIAVVAWRLRDNPQDLAGTPAPAATTQTTPDKIVERADDAGSSSPGAATPVATDEATRTAKDLAPGAGSATQASGQQLSGGSPAAPGSAQPVSEASLPIAYKAAILIDAPDTPEKVKTYVGTVVWHAQNVATGQGQPIGTAIQADVSIPEADVQLTLQIRRNTESQLPASHTMDLKFTVGAGSAVGTIKQVSVPQMRQQDKPTGDPLAGIPVTIADNYFLIGLMRGAAEDRNLDLLRSRQWIDIPLLLASGKASKITFEKGANGDRIFNDVLNGWKNAQN